MAIILSSTLSSACRGEDAGKKYLVEEMPLKGVCFPGKKMRAFKDRQA